LKTLIRFVFLSGLLLVASGCTFTSKADQFNGLPGADGKAVSHLNVSKLSLTLLFGSSQLAGDATLDATVSEMTSEAKSDGANTVRIVQSDESLYWWVFPPFSFILTPMMSNVAADYTR
jgi:hypothetical protein